MRRAALLLLAASLAAADVQLPEASTATKVPEAAAVVSLDDQGGITVEKDGTTLSVSLDQLAHWLRPEGGETKSEKAVLVRADGRAPWLHVCRILETCAQVKMYRTGFGVKGAKGEEAWLAAHLRVNMSPPQRKPATTKLAVEIAVTKDETGVWGPTQTPINQPVEIAFRMGETEVTELEQVRRYIRDGYQTAIAMEGAVVVGEIRSDPRIPHATVVAVLNEFHRAGLRDVVLHAPEPAAPTERQATRLPYPSK